jgi:flagellar protein FlgJ
MNLKIDPRSSFPVHHLQKKNDDSKTKELEDLRSSCREFEAIYIQEMYKSMRKTIPDSGLFKKGMAEEVYREMIDVELAKQTAAGDGMGIGKKMYDQLYKIHYSDKPK